MALTFMQKNRVFRILLLPGAKYFKITFLVRRDESPENYCHSPGVVGGVVVVVVVVVRRQKL